MLKFNQADFTPDIVAGFIEIAFERSDMLQEPDQHQMDLEATYPSGAEEWYCPTCGRRFIMQWTPTYNMIVIEAGDEHASHSGSAAGSNTGASQLAPVQGTQTGSEPNLSVWVDWLETVDFDAWWEKDIKEDF